MPRRISDYPDGFAGWNLVSSLGSIISVAATALFLHILYVQLVYGKAAHRYSWLATEHYDDSLQALLNRATVSLEWNLSSPPKPHAFASLPLQSLPVVWTNLLWIKLYSTRPIQGFALTLNPDKRPGGFVPHHTDTYTEFDKNCRMLSSMRSMPLRDLCGDKETTFVLSEKASGLNLEEFHKYFSELEKEYSKVLDNNCAEFRFVFNYEFKELKTKAGLLSDNAEVKQWAESFVNYQQQNIVESTVVECKTSMESINARIEPKSGIVQLVKQEGLLSKFHGSNADQSPVLTGEGSSDSETNPSLLSTNETLKDKSHDFTNMNLDTQGLRQKNYGFFDWDSIDPSSVTNLWNQLYMWWLVSLSTAVIVSVAFICYIIKKHRKQYYDNNIYKEKHDFVIYRKESMIVNISTVNLRNNSFFSRLAWLLNKYIFLFCWQNVSASPPKPHIFVILALKSMPDTHALEERARKVRELAPTMPAKDDMYTNKQHLPVTDSEEAARYDSNSAEWVAAGNNKFPDGCPGNSLHHKLKTFSDGCVSAERHASHRISGNETSENEMAVKRHLCTPPTNYYEDQVGNIAVTTRNNPTNVSGGGSGGTNGGGTGGVSGGVSGGGSGGGTGGATGNSFVGNAGNNVGTNYCDNSPLQPVTVFGPYKNTEVRTILDAYTNLKSGSNSDPDIIIDLDTDFDPRTILNSHTTSKYSIHIGPDGVSNDDFSLYPYTLYDHTDNTLIYLAVVLIIVGFIFLYKKNKKNKKFIKVRLDNSIDNFTRSNFQAHPFHLVSPSPWPLNTCISLFALTTTGVLTMHSFWFANNFLFVAITCLILCMSFWFRDITSEGTYLGNHTGAVQKGLNLGVALFIVSEALFFLAIFWAYFHSSLNPTVELGAQWPPTGVEAVNPFELPIINTIILLSSGFTVTYAHHCLIQGNRVGALNGLLFTVILAFVFTSFQGVEYSVSFFEMGDSTFGSCFYFGTGFHGLHVMIGGAMIAVGLWRMLAYHSTENHHLGLESGILYWHFVDVVWIFLFISMYYWGS